MQRLLFDVRLATDEILTFATVYVPGWLGAAAIAFVACVLLAAKEIDTQKNNELRILRLQCDLARSDHEAALSALAEEKSSAAALKCELCELQRRIGFQFVKFNGQDCTPRKETVRVEYVLAEDRSLAESIISIFGGEDFTTSSWMVDSDARHVLASKNPNEHARVVIFANHDLTKRVASTINKWRLIPEPVRAEDTRPGQDADCLVVVFDHRRKF